MPTTTAHQRQRIHPLQLFEQLDRVNICAPMVRYSKLPFRKLVRQYNTDLCFTPMILAREFGNSEWARESDFTTSLDDGPLIVQFASNDGVELADAAELIAPYVDGVDINCGCPQRWAIQERIGSYLMHDPQLVKELVTSVKARMGNDFCCSVKIRVLKDSRDTVLFAQNAQMAGADFVTVHGRTRTQKSNSVPVNLDKIKLVRENLDIPVVANGDVFDLSDAERIYKYTGVKGVMSARGILANPALFAGEPITPWNAVERFVRYSLESGLSYHLFHHHIAYMLEASMAKSERLAFNSLNSTAGVLDYLTENYELDLKAG